MNVELGDTAYLETATIISFRSCLSYYLRKRCQENSGVLYLETVRNLVYCFMTCRYIHATRRMHCKSFFKKKQRKNVGRTKRLKDFHLTASSLVTAMLIPNDFYIQYQMNGIYSTAAIAKVAVANMFYDCLY